MPWCIFERSSYADSRELKHAWFGCVLAKKSCFPFLWAIAFSIDLAWLWWVRENWNHIHVAWCSMMLLVCLIWISAHFENPSCMRIVIVCCSCWIYPAQKSSCICCFIVMSWRTLFYHAACLIFAWWLHDVDVGGWVEFCVNVEVHVAVVKP